MYMITVDYFTMLHLWHLYRYIFFIWKHYFIIFFPYVYHTCYSIFFHYICLVCRCCLLYHRYVFWTHYNIIDYILLQILWWFFMTCKVYVKFVSIHLSIFSYVKMIFDRYLSHICQFFSYVKMDIFIQMHSVYSF